MLTCLYLTLDTMRNPPTDGMKGWISRCNVEAGDPRETVIQKMRV